MNFLKYRGLPVAAILAATLPGTGFAEGLGGLPLAIDTPRSGTASKDDLAISFDFREDYRALAFEFQATDRAAIGLSFPTYYEGGASSSGNEISLAFRVLSEGRLNPDLTVGIVGLGSDDRGSGEYIVAGKTFGPMRASVGLGWGRYAAAYDGPRGSGADGPLVETDHLFKDDYEPFANIVWDTGVRGLSAAAEYSGVANGDEDESYALGVSYELFAGLQVGGFTDNAGDSGIRLTFHANPNEPSVQANIGRGPHPYVERRPVQPGQPQPSAEQVLAVAQERLSKEGIRISRFVMAGAAIDVTALSDTDVNFARISGRVARVLSAVAPATITQFRITQNVGAFDTNVIVLDRDGLDNAVGEPNAAALAWEATTLETSPLVRPAGLAETAFKPRFSYDIKPSFKADFITSEDLQLTGTLTANARYTFSPQTFVAGALGYRFLNQWDQVAPPPVPTVRSDITSYTPDEVYLQSLTVRHRFRLTPEIYSRVSAGLFERAYGGVSGELLWRSPQQNFALGVEASYVQKRAYEDWFGFEDADATTLIGSVYANLGASGNYLVVDAGQHLADDFAVGLTVGRHYSNGWRIAGSTVWSDESDSPLKFGAEVTIPLSWASPDAGKRTMDLSVSGQSGDFGSRLSGTGLLVNELRDSDRQRIEDSWGQFWN